MSKKTIAKKIALERGSFLHNKKTGKKEEKEHDLSSKENTIVDKFISENQKQGLRIFVAGGSRSGNSESYVNEAYKLGQTIEKMGFKLDFGLSSQGIMGAVAKGVMDSFHSVKRKNKKSPINAITTDMYLSFYENDDILNKLENIVVAKTLEDRKKMLLDADFIFFAPGGIGTLDELVYDCVAMQDGMLPAKPFIVFNVDGFFHHLLEYLKHINLTGFADKMPFIVIDNIEEAEIVFEMLKDEELKKIKLSTLYNKVRKIIYVLPYIMKQSQLHPKMAVSNIVKEMKEALTSDDDEKIRITKMIIEKEYLKKEIERMYMRFSLAAQDVATQGEKLDELLDKIMKHKKLTTDILFK